MEESWRDRAGTTEKRLNFTMTTTESTLDSGITMRSTIICGMDRMM